MAVRSDRGVDPALLPLIRALARYMVEKDAQEEAEAAPDLAELRSILGLDHDFPNWKRKAEGLMKAFYKHVPHWTSMPLKARVRLVIAAVQELGRNASYRRVALRAAELAELELKASSPRRRRRRETLPSDNS